MIDPLTALALAARIRQLYVGAEVEALERVARRLARGIDQPGWAEAKASQLAALRRELEQVIARLERDGPDQFRELLEQAYRDGATSAASSLGEASIIGVRAHAVEALVQAQVARVAPLHFPILRSALDAYRAAVAESVGPAVAGVTTRRQAAAATMRRFADAGLSGFVDTRGRRWDLASYAEMATRTSIGQAHLEGRVGELQAHGHDLGIISDSPDECPICRPWEGKVISLSGSDPGRPSLDEARSAGVWHPGCTHAVGAYIEGLTRRFTHTADRAGNVERARQRDLERQIRFWKRREAAVAPLDEAAALTARRHLRDRQATMRTFIAETDRRRDYGRESVAGAR